MPSPDPTPMELFTALRHGDLDAMGRWLDGRPILASEVLVIGRRRQTPLQVITDWPGYWPNGPAMVRILLRYGADPNACERAERPVEKPLHWAASSDDVDVGEALIDGGADIEAPGGSIAGGSPLDNAVGYACWHMARLLVARGARINHLWHASALGLLVRLETLMASDPAPGKDAVNQAFWHACAGGQRRAAEYLLLRGADPDFVPDYAKGSAIDVAIAPDTRREQLASWLRDRRSSSKPAAD